MRPAGDPAGSDRSGYQRGGQIPKAEGPGLPKLDSWGSMSQVSLRTLPADGARTGRKTASSSKRHDGIFGGYNDVGNYSKAFDEMFDAQGNVRGPYKGIFAELAPSDASELAARSEALGRAF